MSYHIKRDYIPYGQSRSGYSIDLVRFIVAHDTGNGGSSAQGNVNWFSGNPVNASAHTFIDDEDIIEMLPLNEKAWHVIYNERADNRLFGDDANDCAIGVELCYGGSIDFGEAYKRYVWYLAYLCKKFSLNPKTDIVGHSRLDPGRKTDPENALNRYGKTFDDLIRDIYQEFNGKPLDDGYIERGESGKQVEVLQLKLKKLGHYDMAIDGHYGPGTEKAVKEFQKAHNLTVDGYYGPNTQEALETAIKPDYQTAVQPKEEDEKVADDINKVSSWAKDDWEEAQANGYFDGSRPGADLTREEAAIVVNRIRHNFLELIEANEKEIAELKRVLKENNLI